MVKGGEGSGNFGHAGIPGQVGGSLSRGSTADKPERKVTPELQQSFEAQTVPLRTKLKLDDQVTWLDDSGHMQFGQIDFGGDKETIAITNYTSGQKFRVPRSELRMPRGGFRTRGE